MPSESTTSPEEQTRAAEARARRKACDLCVNKKIKCDMLKPTCSNCSLYNAACQTTSAVRPPPSRPRRRHAANRLDHAEEEQNDLRSRLERLEIMLQQRDERPRPSDNTVTTIFDFIGSDDSGPDPVPSETERKTSAWEFDPVNPKLYYGPGIEGMPLPPLYDIMPVVDHYFNTCNKVTPLFDRKSFTFIMTEWYNRKSTRNRVSWAAILVVCALGLRSPAPGVTTCSDQVGLSDWANHCMRNAQSVVPDLITREEDLLGVQILLGLASLFHHGCDTRPAGVFLGMAMRLVHRLYLHTTHSPEYFSVEECQQRAKIFWIAYILDKDISLKTMTPSIHSDRDNDVALPPLVPSDEVGLIWTQDRRTSFNYFRMRIDLAHVQGRIHDLLYSTTNLKIQGAARTKRVEGLQSMLDQWMSRIPTAFRIEHVSSTVEKPELAQMVRLYHAYLGAIIFLHGIYSKEAEWVQRLGSMGRAAIEDYSAIVTGRSLECSSRQQAPPLESGWKHCVEFSRSCVKLFQDTIQTEWSIWQYSYAHFSGLIIILSNIIIDPTHDFVSLDSQIAVTSMQLLDRLATSVQGTAFVSLRQIANSLVGSARDAVDEERLQQAAEGDGNAYTGSIDPGSDWFSAFPTFNEFGDAGAGTALDLDATFDTFMSNEPTGREA